MKLLALRERRTRVGIGMRAEMRSGEVLGKTVDRYQAKAPSETINSGMIICLTRDFV